MKEKLEMNQVKSPPSGFHTKIKHKIIKYHFSSTWKNIFKNDRVYNLWYVDLFCGPGFCENKEIREEQKEELPKDWGKKIWEPPFFDLIKYADESHFNLKCIFNDFEEEKINSLKKKIEQKGYSNFVKRYESEDANSFYETALEEIGNPKVPSLFFLDPTNHKDLKFETVKNIAEFKAENGRRPELIINFMVNTIFMAYKRGLPEKDVKTINEFFGENFSKERLKGIQENSKRDTEKALLNIYLKKLEELDYNCSHYLVKDVNSNVPIYYLIFATTSDEAHSMYKNLKSRIEELMQEKWIKKLKYEIKPKVDRDRNQRTISEFG